MLELDFLGVQPDGTHVMLNDSEGNRYSLEITDELRAALRRDNRPRTSEDPKPMAPKEIQALFRSGKTLEEVSDITSLPASQLSPYEYPIIAERSYMAQRARGFRLGHEIGALSVEELVVSRLRAREVSPSDISWDAVRDNGKSWELIASYPAGGENKKALWSIDVEASRLRALNDEATWLSETEIPVKDTPWRPVSSTRKAENADTPKPAPTSSPDEADDSALISMLDGLNARRGQQRPAPQFDVDEFPPAAHPPASRPDQATDATVLSLPPRPAAEPEDDENLIVASSAISSQSAHSAESADEAEDTATELAESVSADSAPSAQSAESPKDSAPSDHDGGLFPAPEPKKRKKNNRPAMPSWDEIVFGQSKKD